MTTAVNEQRMICTFLVGDAHFGIDALDVQEVLRTQPMTEVPLAGAEVRGLINLRGQIVTAIDLHTRLGLDTPRATTAPMNVVVRTDDGPVSFLVDQIGDVIELDPELLGHAPETVGHIDRDVVTAIHPLDDLLLIILDVERLCAPVQSA